MTDVLTVPWRAPPPSLARFGAFTRMPPVVVPAMIRDTEARARTAPARIDKTFCFGAFRFTPQRQLLLRGGAQIRLGSRAMDLLHLLVEHAGDIVGKGELIRFAWPDTFVDESNLKVNICALRAALGESEAVLPYIATVPGRGYRFVAEIQIEQGQAPSPPPGPAVKLQNFPAPQPLFGRDEVVATLSTRLISEGFVTITGPAGVGKTSVAAAVARHVAGQFDQGACFVDLASISDARLVSPAVATALGAGGTPYGATPGLVDVLRDGSRLLVLDNCEHLSNAVCVVVSHLRAALPDLAVLCTARAPLDCASERVHRLAPLPCPAEEERNPAALRGAPALALFLERSRAASPDARLEDDLHEVAALCRRLDGLPLAIDLAARLRPWLAPGDLLARLEEDFTLLDHGCRTTPLRQQGLSTAIEWSYRLLSDLEAAVFRSASAFDNGFTVDDVLRAAEPNGQSPEAIERAISNLAAKSLFEADFIAGKLQYRMLKSTRSYASLRFRLERPVRIL